MQKGVVRLLLLPRGAGACVGVGVRGRHSSSSSAFYVAPNVTLRTAVRKFPLSGIKVALLNRPSFGEFTARILEDFGAEVTKFCEPAGPFPLTEAHGRQIDLSTDEDRNLVKNIARKVDILIDYLNGGRLEQVGLDPEAMLVHNSKLIVARITGYGQTGVYGPRMGADTTYAALSGAMSGIRSSNEQSLQVARREAKALAMAGRANCVTGVIMALYDREHTGKGQIVDMSVTESIAYIDRVAHLCDLQIPKAFHRFYTTSDAKLLSVGVSNPQQQQQFLEILKVDGGAEDLQDKIAAQIAQKPLATLLNELKDIGSVTEVFDHSNVGTHKQHRERDCFELDSQSNKWIAKSVPQFHPRKK